MSKSFRAVGISGSPSATSQSRALLDAALSELRSHGVTTELVDLRRLDADALLNRGSDPDVAQALALVQRVEIVVVGSPTYRATYSGLLKVFLDLLPADCLTGKVVIPLMTGGGPHHLLAIEHGLKPAIASLGAVLTPSGVYGVPQSFHQGTPNVELKSRVQQAVGEALALASAADAGKTASRQVGKPHTETV